MNTYKIYYNRKEHELHASSLYAAKVLACQLLKVPRSKQSMVSVVLCEVAGKQVEVSTAAL